MDEASKKSLETVMAFMGAMGSGDMDAMHTLMADDMVWHNEGDPSLPWIGETRGKENIFAFLGVFGEYRRSEFRVLRFMNGFAEEDIDLSASVTLGGWHLMLHLNRHKGPLVRTREALETELYDLSSDPDCLKDLDTTETEKAVELAGHLLAWLRTQGSPSLAGLAAVSADQEAFAIEPSAISTFHHERFWLLPGATPARINARYEHHEYKTNCSAKATPADKCTDGRIGISGKVLKKRR